MVSVKLINVIGKAGGAELLGNIQCFFAVGFTVQFSVRSRFTQNTLFRGLLAIFICINCRKLFLIKTFNSRCIHHLPPASFSKGILNTKRCILLNVALKRALCGWLLIRFVKMAKLFFAKYLPTNLVWLKKQDKRFFIISKFNPYFSTLYCTE